jgi:hypothetical protein
MLKRFAEWLFDDWEDSTRRAIKSTIQAFVGTGSVNAVTDLNLTFLNVTIIAAVTGVLTVVANSIKGVRG